MAAPVSGIMYKQILAMIIDIEPEMKVKAVRKLTNMFLLLTSAELVGTTLKCATWIAAHPAFYRQNANVWNTVQVNSLCGSSSEHIQQPPSESNITSPPTKFIETPMI